MKTVLTPLLAFGFTTLWCLAHPRPQLEMLAFAPADALLGISAAYGVVELPRILFDICRVKAKGTL